MQSSHMQDIFPKQIYRLWLKHCYVADKTDKCLWSFSLGIFWIGKNVKSQSVAFYEAR